MSTTIVPLAVATPPDLATVSSSDPSETEPSPSGSAPDDADEPSGGGPTEASAVAALLGLHSAWPSSPVEEQGSEEQDQGYGYGADDSLHSWDAPHASERRGFSYLEDSPYSPRLARGMGYDTPDYPSPKRMRAPKDGARTPLAPPEQLPSPRPKLVGGRPSLGKSLIKSAERESPRR